MFEFSMIGNKGKFVVERVAVSGVGRPSFHISINLKIQNLVFSDHRFQVDILEIIQSAVIATKCLSFTASEIYCVINISINFGSCLIKAVLNCSFIT